ncbi:MAG TPA: proline--tRNA ligase [Phycisphaerales bacterium]|jgi:prolyl-tRNA synthetase|nr:proline--tRNA ligase [Phycisphaerales bacterium]
MDTATKTAIVPTREEDYPQWYQEVIKAADLAENSPVRGCMVIKPWGYGLWENIQSILDARFKATGHKNAYFPLFIPLSYMQREADHVEGFAKECAVVTHHRLEPDADGQLQPAGKLEEPLVVRPTSETIIGEMFSRWIESHRDLPLLINQWANVVRWEMRTRLFLRTTEFLWQEGHTAHATEQEAIDETLQILDIYADFAENMMAMPVVRGAKSEGDRFPGAVATYSIEAMMQDGKALQSGTSHFLGQNFSKAQDISFQNADGELEFAWTTSWGVSTRLIGGIIMTHADDDGMVMPPRLAPAHVVIIPITFKTDDPESVLNYCHKLADDLGVISYHGRSITVEIDNRELGGGDKKWGWIKKGIPIRLEIGPREIESDTVFMARRDQDPKEKQNIPRTQFTETITTILDEMQQGLYDRALARREDASITIDEKDAFYAHFEAGGVGFVYSHFSGDPEVEQKVKRDLKVTLCNIPLHGHDEEGKCIFTGKPSKQRVLWAKAY